MSARLLKVVVQVVAVVDAGGYLTEQVCQPVEVPARDWDAYRAPGGAFDQSWAALAAQVAGPPPIPEPDVQENP